jgi:isoleucyl-tRNA synthetase
MGRACRNACSIKNRQPIGKMLVKAPFELSEFYKEIIEDELNVKSVEFKDDVSDFTSYSFKPQLKTLGPKYGKLIGGIKQALADLDGSEAMNKLNTEGELKLNVNGEEVILVKEDLLIESVEKDGFVSENDNQMTVVLDTNLTPELIEEGFVRELISKIQTMRKEAGFEVMDKIYVYEKGNDKLKGIMENNKAGIIKDVMADDIKFDTLEGYEKEWDINGEKVVLAVKKV